MYRDHTKEIQIGDKKIGGGNPVLIQSMCNTKTENVAATIEQIHRLEDAGCDIIRVAVPTMEAAAAIREIKKQIHIPLVADIHFDYRLAIAAIESGADKIRINPGNIGARERVKAVVDKAKEYGIPIRVGVNSGSLEKDLLAKYGGVTAEALVESALKEVAVVEELGYDNLVISIKSSDVLMCQPTSLSQRRRIIRFMWGSQSPEHCFPEISSPLWVLESFSMRGLAIRSVSP